MTAAFGRFELPTSGTTWDATISGLGWTPSGYFAVVHNNTTNTPSSSAFIGLGLSDGTRQYAFASESDDNQATSSTERGWVDDAGIAYAVFDDSGSLGLSLELTAVSATAGPIANGWRFDVVEPVSSAGKCVDIWFFDFSVYAGVAVPSTGGLDITAPGFQPGLILFSCNGLRNSDKDSLAVHSIMSIGAAALNTAGTDYDNVSLMAFDQDNSSTTNSGTYVSSTYCCGQFFNDTLSWGASAGSPDASGFTLTSNSSPGDDVVGYLAINLGSQSAWAGVIDSPTSAAADWTVTDPGFEPLGFGVFPNANTTTGAQAGLTFGSYGSDGTREGGRLILSQDNVGTSNTQGLRAELKLYDDSGATLLHDMSSPTLTSTGWQFSAANIAAASGTARKWPAWAIEAASTGGDVTFSATAAAAAGASAPLALDLGLGVTSAGSSGASATLSLDIGVTVTSAGSSGASATLSLDINFSGSAAGVAAAAASLSRDLGLGATAAGSSAATGDIVLAGDVTFSAVAAAVSGASGRLIPGAFRTYEVTLDYPTRELTVTAKGFGVQDPSGSITITFDDTLSEYAFRQCVAAFRRYIHRELMKTRDVSLMPTSGSTKE